MVVLSGDRFVQVQGAAADQASAVAVRQSGQGCNRTAARFVAVAVVVGAGGATESADDRKGEL
jgi:hypothetical protein